MLVEHCFQERQAPAKTKYDQGENNHVINHAVLVRLAGLTVILRTVGIAFYQVE